MDKTKFNLSRYDHQLVAGILTILVEDFGYSPHEVFELLEDVKNQMWHALNELKNEKARK